METNTWWPPECIWNMNTMKEIHFRHFKDTLHQHPFEWRIQGLFPSCLLNVVSLNCIDVVGPWWSYLIKKKNLIQKNCSVQTFERLTMNFSTLHVRFHCFADFLRVTLLKIQVPDIWACVVETKWWTLKHRGRTKIRSNLNILSLLN